jgi:hypothetical protein
MNAVMNRQVPLKAEKCLTVGETVGFSITLMDLIMEICTFV